MNRLFTKIILTLFLFGMVFYLGYSMGGHREKNSVIGNAGGDTHDPGSEETIWTCSMHPQIRIPDPGQCPICFMDLIPVKQGNGSENRSTVGMRQISLTPTARKLAEVTVEPVTRRSIAVESRLTGKVDYDETRFGYITSWVAGRIDKLYVDYTGSLVKKGQVMADIYSPELLTAQTELIQAIKALEAVEKSGLGRVKEAAWQTEKAAREKLRLLGLTAQQIEEIAKRDQASDHITLYATMGGVIIKKDVLEGMYVKTGERIYTIADLSRLWVILEAYESDLPWLRIDQKVEFQVEAYPGEIFRGKVVYIDSHVDEMTRTVRVRLDVPNPGDRLKPGMFVRAVKKTGPKDNEEKLVIPASAPLITGKRAIVYVRLPGEEGTYEGREIVLGPRVGDAFIVKEGLSEGELVVTKGNFKIDSAVQLLAKPSMMNPYENRASVGLNREARSEGGQAQELGSSTPSLPKTLALQLPRLNDSYEQVKMELAQGDLQRIRKAFGKVYNVLCGLDPSSLTDKRALIWKEAVMLLKNDSILGQESDTNHEAAGLFEIMTYHYGIIKEHFGVDHIIRQQAIAASVTDEFKQSLGRLLDHYLQIHASLAGDNFPLAKKLSNDFLSILGNIDQNILPQKARPIWTEDMTHLQRGADILKKARDIETLRQAFDHLSVGMARAVEHLGVALPGPVYELFCPMAFNDRGAIWLQQNENIRNPYFGSEMLECGEVKRQIKGDQ